MSFQSSWLGLWSPCPPCCFVHFLGIEFPWATVAEDYRGENGSNGTKTNKNLFPNIEIVVKPDAGKIDFATFFQRVLVAVYSAVEHPGLT